MMPSLSRLHRHVLVARLGLVVLLAAGWGASLRGATVEVVDMPHAVVVAFKGEIFVIQERPTGTHSDKELIAALKAHRVKELSGDVKDDVAQWSFRFLVFPSKMIPGTLKLEFYTDDRDKRFAAVQMIEGVPDAIPCYEVAIEISEDEGLSKGKSYILKLVNDRDAVIAQANLVMK